MRTLALWLSVLLLLVATGCGPAELSGPRPRVLLIGLDGADWSVLEPMMARGELPHLAGIRDRGVRARMRSIQPIISPVIWTTMATGYGPDDHGVIDFTVPDPETGDPIVITSRHRLAKAFWDLLTEQGRSASVVGWWATWPAEEVRGRIVSDRVLAHAFVAEQDVSEGLTYPADLIGEIAPGLISPSDVTFSEATRFLSIDQADWDAADLNDFNDPIGHFRHIYATMTNAGTAAEHLLDDPEDVVAAYFEGTDTAGHMYMRYAPPRYPFSTAEDQQRYGGTVEAFYRYADERFGRLLDKVGEETYVLVVSDHGFLTGTSRPLEARANLDYRTAALWHRLDGVFLLAGPGVRSGVELENVTIFDVLPTLLDLVGLPVAEDFRGRVLTEAFTGDRGVRTVPTYRDRSWSEGRREALLESVSGVDEEMMQKLQSLGYIGGGETGSLVSLRGRLALAQYHLFVGERIQAVEELRGVVSDAPDFYEASYQLGLVALQSRDLHAAERYFRSVLEAEPGYQPAMMNLAFVLKQTGRSGEAEELLQEAARLAPDDPGAQVNLAILLREQGRFEEAVAALDRVLARVPYHASARIQRALALQESGRFEEAVAEWDEVLRLRPDDTRAMEYREAARAGRPPAP